MGSNTTRPRDRNIDILRGIAVVGVVLIHTAFWSGDGWILPQILQQATLLVDVPLFFFVTGMTLAIRISSFESTLQGLSKIYLRYIFFCFLAALACLPFLTGMAPFYNFANYIFLFREPLGPLPVVVGSFWFLPVYLCVFPLAALLVKAPRTQPLLLLLFLHFLILFRLPLYVYHKFPFIEYLLFYLAITISGFLYQNTIYYSVKRSVKKVIFLFVLIFPAGPLFFTDPLTTLSTLQLSKFPPTYPYFGWSIIGITSSIILVSLLRKATSLEPLINKLSFLGENAFPAFFAQGISASLLFFLTPHLRPLPQIAAFPIAAFANLSLCFVLTLLLCRAERSTIRLLAFLVDES